MLRSFSSGSPAAFRSLLCCVNTSPRGHADFARVVARCGRGEHQVMYVKNPVFAAVRDKIKQRKERFQRMNDFVMAHGGWVV